MPSEIDIRALLTELIARGGSDLHIKVASPPLMRIDGELRRVEGMAELTPADTETALLSLLDERQREDFARDGGVDFATTVERVARFRVNGYRQRGSVSIAARAVAFGVRTFDELGLPPVLAQIAEQPRGIVLVTGTTGSGKSTTLAAMIDHMNETMSRHIVTIEDPIEALHADKRSVINQREVGLDTPSFAAALRHVLRQDPDVILIGEMRDTETVSAALSAAETGHLVLSTLHTQDAAETINRILDFYPPLQQPQVRAMLGSTLRGIVSQRLLPTADGNGRAAVCEILISTARVRDMITDPGLTHQLTSVIADGAYYGMQTFDQALLRLLHDGRITMESAMGMASNPSDFELLVSTGGSRGTSMEDAVAAAAHEDEAAQDAAPVPTLGLG